MKKYYLDGDLFYKSKGISGYAQVPHCFTKDHVCLLNKIATEGVRHEEIDGDAIKVYYTLPEKGKSMNDPISDQMAYANKRMTNDEVVERYIPKEIYLQSPEVTGVEYEEITTPVVI